MNWIYRYLDDRAERQTLASLQPIESITSVALDPRLGRGVIASRKIPAGTLLGVYPGAKLSLQNYLDKHELLENAIRYSYRLSQDIIIDPTDIFGYLRDTPELRLALLNEAPPEKRLNVLPLASRNNIWYLVIRDIREKDPLYTFYGASYARNYPSSTEQEAEQQHAGTKFTEGEVSLLRETAKRCRWLRNEVEAMTTRGQRDP